MKIAQIAPPWISVPPKNYGGTETVLHCLVEEQVTQGHEVTLFASEDSQTSARHIPIFAQGLRDEGFDWKAFELEKRYLQTALAFVKEQEFDIVHTHLSSGGDMFLFPLLADYELPHVTTLHSNLPFRPEETPSEVNNEHVQQWLPKVPIIAISESARRQQKLPLHFIGVVHHGIPVDDYQQADLQPDNYFLWLGRFSPEKGAHLAIEASKQAGVPLILAGTVDSQNERMQTYFHAQIEPHLNDKNIRYYGPADKESKIQLFSKARGFLNPIEWEEPFGMVMAESIAAGCPVISFARGAAPELIKDGQSGFLVQNVPEMVAAIQRIDTIQRDAVAKYAQENFSLRTMANKYIALYHKACQTHKEQQAKW
jgi:glycosyltransferase involved in cell wall biosynthesis